MRPRSHRRRTRTIHVAIATIMLSVPASALALTGTATDTHAAPTATPLQAKVSPRRVSVNHEVIVSGIAPLADAGHHAIVQTALTRNSGWRFLTSAIVGRNGRFSVRTRLRHSGFVRVINSPVLAASASTGSAAPAAVTPAASSRLMPVVVQARFKVGAALGQPADRGTAGRVRASDARACRAPRAPAGPLRQRVAHAGPRAYRCSRWLSPSWHGRERHRSPPAGHVLR